MAAFEFNQFFMTLDRIGFVDILLPFLLIFTIIFAVLEKTKILGEGKKNMNVGIALIFALITVIPHATGNFPAGCSGDGNNRRSAGCIFIFHLIDILQSISHDRRGYDSRQYRDHQKFSKDIFHFVSPLTVTF